MNSLFGSLKNFLIKKLGGFIDLDDALDSVTSAQRRYILTLTTKRLFNTIGADDILKMNEVGNWMVEGKEISEVEKNHLISEATILLNSRLWKVLNLDIKYQANRKMFILGGDDLQISAGKLWLLSLDVLKQRLENMRSENGNFGKH